MAAFFVSLGIVLLGIQAIIGLAYLLTCLWENERRATGFAVLQFTGMILLLAGYIHLARSGFFDTLAGKAILFAAYAAALGGLVMLARRTGINQRAVRGTDGYVVDHVQRFDERDQVFARNRSLRPGSEEYQQYYEGRPQWEAADAGRREKGGPLGRVGAIDSPDGGVNVAGTFASLSVPHHLSRPSIVSPAAHPVCADGKPELSPEAATERVKGYARHIGADLVGIAKIDPRWIYSHRGEIFNENWEDWGKEIAAAHAYAVITAQEMDFFMVGTAPHTPSVMESMRNYSRGAAIATQLAAYIANLGYGATANHLRHYTAILPPLAVDAGLGEIGRLGYLITRQFGPRVRLSAVTTDLPLVPDKPEDFGVEDFCRICKKCAVSCPSRSIPHGRDPEPFNGTLRWKLDGESCFDYWARIGTDCCICMRACPWSHPRTWPHRLIVWLITRNRNARRLFLWMDDIFYGRKPKPKPPPRWAGF
jgi:reductive dehalogenase